MSLRDLANLATSVDDDDDAPPVDTTPEPKPVVRTSNALAQAMLDAALTPYLRRLMAAPSRLILIKTADAAAADLLDRHLSGLRQGKTVEAFTELHKSGGKLEPRGSTELASLEHGRTVILISQDPERLIVAEALAAADAVIDVPAPDLAIIRKTMRLVTGKLIRGLTEADIDGLGIADLTTAIRPNLSPRECLANLRRAVLIRQAPTSTSTAVSLERLALTRVVADWAHDTLDLMAKVAAGELETDALRHACLEGPPGTGKTTVAAALARSAGWGFVGTSVGTWFAESNGHLGDVVRAARKFFDELALAKGPVVGLIDELDALPNRATMDREDASFWTPVITFVLTEIDRVRKSGQPVLLVAATNQVQHLDAALTRPGRLERRVSVLLPDESERRAMFSKLLADRLTVKGLGTLARLSPGATPAQIESWCATALAAANGENRVLSLRDLVDLIAPPSQRSSDMDRAIALHEAGHAIVALELGLPVLEISIIGAGAVGGWVNTRADDRLLTRDGVERTGTVMLAGRAADMLLGDGAHAGAAHDLDNVNALLRSAMLELGLYGSLTTGANTDLRNFTGTTFWNFVGVETDRLLARASEIVDRRRDDILRLVDTLLVERVVTGERLAELLKIEAEDPSDSAEEPDADVCADASAPSASSGRR